MAKKAAGKPFILVNPNLADRPSHSGIMGARGREERMAFADSFATAFAFETLHVKGLYKIEGAVGKVMRCRDESTGECGFWTAKHLPHAPANAIHRPATTRPGFCIVWRRIKM